MGGLVERVVAAVAVAVAVASASSCATTVGGTAVPARPGAQAGPQGYGYDDGRCGRLGDDVVMALVGATSVVKPFGGAVCQYLAGTGTGLVDVVFWWFDTGTVDRERGVAVDRGSRITDGVVARRPAFLAQRPDNAGACSATAGAGTGVLTWWVQFRPTAGDPCRAAEALLSATLSADS